MHHPFLKINPVNRYSVPAQICRFPCLLGPGRLERRTKFIIWRTLFSIPFFSSILSCLTFDELVSVIDWDALWNLNLPCTQYRKVESYGSRLLSEPPDDLVWKGLKNLSGILKEILSGFQGFLDANIPNLTVKSYCDNGTHTCLTLNCPCWDFVRFLEFYTGREDEPDSDVTIISVHTYANSVICRRQLLLSNRLS